MGPSISDIIRGLARDSLAGTSRGIVFGSLVAGGSSATILPPADAHEAFRMIEYNLQTRTGLLEVAYRGRITANDLNAYGDRLAGDSELPRRLRILTDATEAEYSVTPQEIAEIEVKLREHMRRFECIRAAFIQSRPRETALSMLLERKSETTSYEHAVFSTREAAYEWVMLPFGDED